MDSSVNLRIQRDAQPPLTLFHASDTLRNVLLQVGAVNAWEEGNVSLFDVGRSPAVAFEYRHDLAGLFPGGRWALRQKLRSLMLIWKYWEGSFSCPSSSDATICYFIETIPSEVLSSHITRFTSTHFVDSTSTFLETMRLSEEIWGGNGEVGAAVVALAAAKRPRQTKTVRVKHSTADFDKKSGRQPSKSAAWIVSILKWVPSAAAADIANYRPEWRQISGIISSISPEVDPQ